MQDNDKIISRETLKKVEQQLKSLDFLENKSQRQKVLDVLQQYCDCFSLTGNIHKYIDPQKTPDNTVLDIMRIFDSFFKHTLTPIVFLDSRFNFIWVNDAYAKSCDKPASFFTGKNHFDVYPHKENQEIFESVLHSKKTYEARSKLFVYPDHPEWGDTYWDWNLVPIVSTGGDVDLLILSLKNVTDVKLAELKLAESEKTYRMLVENANSIILQSQLNGEITFFNEFAQKFFGYSEEEVIGKKAYDTIVPKTDSSGRDLSSLIEDIIQNPDKHPLNENENICKDGTRVWVSWTNKPLKDDNGNNIGLLAVGSDITKRKEAENITNLTNYLLNLFVKKTSRQEYLDCVVEAIRNWSDFDCVGIRLKNDNGEIPYVSYLGYAKDFLKTERQVSLKKPHCLCARTIADIPEDIDNKISLGKHSYGINNAIDFMNNLPPQLKTKYLNHCIKGEFDSVIIVPIIHQNERLGIIHLADRRNNKADENMAQYLETIAALIAEAIHRFDVEEKLTESTERLKTVVACSPIILFAIDTKGIILLVEGTSIEKLDLDPEYLIGKNIFEVYKDNRDFTSSITRALNGGSTKAIVSSIEDYTFEVNYSPILDADGTVKGLTGVALDISERVKAEQKVADYQSQLRSLTAELVLAEQRERRRIAEQLHDCLGPIISHSARELGILVKKSPKEINEPLKKIEKLLHDVARRTRSITFEISPPSLYNFGFQFAVEELAETFGNSYGINIEFKCTGEQPKIDEKIQVLIFRSIRELMLNIVKHAKTKYAEIQINMLDDNLEIIVSDKGVGFDTAELNSTKNGDGFGLFSIRERLTHIGGNMNISSELSKGTTITMYIPIIRDIKTEL